MTPFANAFKTYRKRSRLRQKQVAFELELSVSYISSWETGLKPPPHGEPLTILCKLFELTETEAAEFIRFARLSQPLLRVPRNTTASGYLLAHKLVHRLPGLCAREIDLICRILDLRHEEASMSP
jgi:transcriptional regulator with XRE-family HTH domain